MDGDPLPPGRVADPIEVLLSLVSRGVRDQQLAVGDLEALHQI